MPWSECVLTHRTLNPRFLKESTAVTIAANQHQHKISVSTGPCEVRANRLSNSTRYLLSASISELQQKPWFQCIPKIYFHHQDYANQCIFWPYISLGETQSYHLPARKTKIWRYAQCLEFFFGIVAVAICFFDSTVMKKFENEVSKPEETARSLCRFWNITKWRGAVNLDVLVLLFTPCSVIEQNKTVKRLNTF